MCGHYSLPYSSFVTAYEVTDLVLGLQVLVYVCVCVCYKPRMMCYEGVTGCDRCSVVGRKAAGDAGDGVLCEPN